MSSFYVPSDLRVTPDRIERVSLLGGCVFDRWRDVLARKAPGIAVDLLPFDYNGQLIEEADRGDFRIVQVPLRYLYPEVIVMQARFEEQADGSEATLISSRQRLKRVLGKLGGASEDRPTFFLNYPLPQRGALGRLMPRYDSRNPAYFLQRLNRQLSDLVDDYPGGHILDMEQCAAAFGRRYVQDDAFWLYAHGGLISDFDSVCDVGRLDPTKPLSELHRFDVEGFIDEVWDEAFAMLRTLRGTDRVKMVCVDLDDTLWRGIPAESDLMALDQDRIEGWPLGFAESLLVLKQRGILLGIISKNDAARAEEIMAHLFGGRLSMADFAIRKINWQPKSQNLADAIREANVLPDSVVYIDDNPVERAAVKRALPEVRVLEAPHQDWRRILLWSPESQVATISAESATRTEMVQGQVAREEARREMGDDSFLADLGIDVELRRIDGDDHPQFERAFELLNKTNQFNTNGGRWTHEEARAHFATGGHWWTFTARDRFTIYGLVGVIVIDQGHIPQFVMSCRVFGLGIEQAALAMIEAAQSAPLSATLLTTERNGPCRHVYAQAGWTVREEVWCSPGSTPKPPHVHARIV
ncbi:hypothetical protein ASE00_20070 [Sphingomonas sp. Root710]|uniref:HAD-IIIC family phosphatase n=1 Tax=Sphingomonas sp. Root710 TaxID=1736594 RepID=UPI0006FF7C70|nr:HAD-IIIC family phosphatase [Sphingomonas sp. Root710]KRB79405.1 hypothetical protein ASE00_20070 [Sphingomonas sp. Root710]